MVAPWPTHEATDTERPAATKDWRPNYGVVSSSKREDGVGPDEGQPALDALYSALVQRLRSGDESAERLADGNTRWLGHGTLTTTDSSDDGSPS
jgi:hypothetical protein